MLPDLGLRLILQEFKNRNSHGRRPRGDWGRSPKYVGWGNGPCIRPPIFWEVVLSDVRESKNRVKRRCDQGINFLNRGFSREEWVMYDIWHSKDMENNDRKNLKNMIDE